MITRRITRTRPSGLLKSASSWTCPSCVRPFISSNGAYTTTTTYTPQTRASLIPQIQQQQQSPSQTRYLSSTPIRNEAHKMPATSYNETFKEKGVPGLLSKDGYDLAWTQYQNSLHRKLNDLVAGEPIEHMSTKELTHVFARDPMNAALFNHASMAWNNHFFFDSMSPAPLPITKVPQLEDSLVKTFGSIETLRATMLDTADSMFGPGFVWLVWANDANVKFSGSRKGSWKILTTYLAGTPFPEAGYRQQGVDMNNSNPNSYQAYLAQQAATPANSAGYFGSNSRKGQDNAKLPPGGTSLMPVLCVNTWQHVWLYDFGIDGKRRYLQQWWDAIDWGHVEARAPPESKQTAGFYATGGY